MDSDFQGIEGTLTTIGGETLYPSLNRRHPDARDPIQPKLDVRDREEVGCAVVPGRFVVFHQVQRRLDRDSCHCTTSKPRPVQPGKSGPPGNEASLPGGIAKHLV